MYVVQTVAHAPVQPSQGTHQQVQRGVPPAEPQTELVVVPYHLRVLPLVPQPMDQ
jgi:hypothetical protein